MNRISFFFKEAIRSIGRNPIPSFAALMAVLITVLVLGIFIPAVQLANGAADDVRGLYEQVLAAVQEKVAA